VFKTIESMSNSEEVEKNMFEGLIAALADKQSQVDLTFQRTTLRFPGTAFSMQVDGTVSMVVHMRELTDEEKAALVSKNVANISSQGKEQFSPLK
jgi:hypothetical protein